MAKSCVALILMFGWEAGAVGPEEALCSKKALFFSSDELPKVPPASKPVIWGGNAAPWDETRWNASTYTSAFRKRALRARKRGHDVFAYLEGPCGDTGGRNDGERATCAQKHARFIRSLRAGERPEYRFLLDGLSGKGVSEGSPKSRWFPYTFAQLLESGANHVDHCEVDNLSNNVTIPLVPFLRKYQELYSAGKIHCRLVLKNVSKKQIQNIRAKFGTEVDFISPFHLFEADELWRRNRKAFQREHERLTDAMIALRGEGAVTIMSKNTNSYSSRNFTRDNVRVCRRPSNENADFVGFMEMNYPAVP